MDELVPKEQLLSAAEAVMLKLVMLPSGAVDATKKSLRGEFCSQVSAHVRRKRV